MDVLSELIKFLQSASPVVWQALIRQVYVEAIGYVAWGIGLVVFSSYAARFAKARLEEDDILGVFSYIGSFLSAIASLLLLTSAIQHFINPNFYAIRFIVQSVTGG